MKEWYNPVATSAAHEPQALSLLHTTTSFEWKLPNLSGRQEVHHQLVVLFYHKKLRDLHVLASPCFPAHHLSHCLPLYSLAVSPLAAVAEDVFPRVEHSPSTPPAFAIISVAKPVKVDSSLCMPRL